MIGLTVKCKGSKIAENVLKIVEIFTRYNIS